MCVDIWMVHNSRRPVSWAKWAFLFARGQGFNVSSCVAKGKALGLWKLGWTSIPNRSAMYTNSSAR